MAEQSSPALADSAQASEKPRRRSRFALVFYRPKVLLAVGLLLLIVVVALLAPVIAPADPNQQSLLDRLSPPMTETAKQKALLGTDQLGRDVLSRVIYGSRVSLLVGLFSVVFAGTLGVALGMCAGFFGGFIDTLLMRLVDVLLAFPFVLLALTVVAVLGTSVVNVILVFTITSWVSYARTSRASVLALRDTDYVVVARALGASSMRIVTRHIVPNMINPIIVLASFEMARIITTEASLTFLGVGIPPTTPTWGAMISDGRQYLRDAWWIAAFPGLMLFLLVLSVSFIGDALREVFDPRSVPR
ncbi:MAG: ABC transporter permease [Thermomicrobiales bacterium]|nr:ABC transporter permease [Thermomicrobiales bacterium]